MKGSRVRPRALLLSGILLTLAALGTAYRRWQRERYIADHHASTSPNPIRSDLYWEEREAAGFLRKGRLCEATVRLHGLLARPDLTEAEKDWLVPLQIRIRADEGMESDRSLLEILSRTSSADTWLAALQHLVDHREYRGDPEGAIEVLRSAVRGEIPRPPGLLEAPFPYVEAEFTPQLVELLLRTGGSLEALVWSLRLKYDFAVDVVAVCGTGHRGYLQGSHDAAERFIARSVAQLGGTYFPEPFDTEVRLSRAYGPPYWSAGVSAVIGAIIQVLGLRAIFSRRRGYNQVQPC